MSRGDLQTECIRGASNRKRCGSRGTSLPPSFTHLDAELCLISYRGQVQLPDREYEANSLFLYFLCLSLVIFPSLFCPSLLLLLFALFLSICLAGTTECPRRAGMQQKASLKESSGCKAFISCCTWPRQAAG